MISTFYISIFIIWLLFWSFSTVLIIRWHEKENGILFWRSKCPKCSHTLSWFELFPLFSYIFLGWKCRKCRVKIPFFYPLSELVMWGIFLLVTLSFVKMLWYSFNWEYLLLLLLGFITWVYVLADIRYMEIPDEIMIPWFYWYLIVLIGGFFSEKLSSLFFDRFTYLWEYSDFFFDHLYGALVLYTFLYLQILIPATIALIKRGNWKWILEVIISYFSFFYYVVFPPKNDEKNDENDDTIETWVWGWDLRIALFIGITLGLSHGIFAFFIAYMVWSFIGIIILILYGKKRARIPFWPFLAIWWLTSLYFHTEIVTLLEFYKSLF